MTLSQVDARTYKMREKKMFQESMFISLSPILAWAEWISTSRDPHLYTINTK